jgi:hypothetical protein
VDSRKPSACGCLRIHIRVASIRSRGDYRGAAQPDPDGSCSGFFLLVSYTPPAFVGSPKQRARFSARLCDGVGSCRPTPCAQPSTTASGEERSGRANGADAERGFALWAKLRGGPPAPPSFANVRQALHSKAEWGHGVGRHARQMRGEIVSTCKELRVRSRSLRVQTGLYRSLYPSWRPSFSLKKTHNPV